MTPKHLLVITGVGKKTIVSVDQISTISMLAFESTVVNDRLEITLKSGDVIKTEFKPDDQYDLFEKALLG